MKRMYVTSLIGIVGAALFAYVPCVSAASSITYTGSGTFTVPEGVTTVWVSMSGGGGGGGYNPRFFGGGGGGGAAAVDSQEVSVSGGQVIPITIGAGGSFNVSGGASSFGTYISTSGGAPANMANGGAAGGLGGSSGQGGQTSLAGGAGGSSLFGTGGAGGVSGNGHGKNGAGYGGGGGGGAAGSDPGSGSGGFVKIAFTRSIPNVSQTFASSGTFVVPQGITSVQVSMSGGGGGGVVGPPRFFGGGGGGGAAAVDSQEVSVSGGQVVPITIGAGGGPSSTNGSLGSGGTSLFGSYVSTPGGFGAKYYGSAGAAGGLGGLPGQAGKTSLAGGAGGNSLFGTGGAGAVPGGPVGGNGSGYGSGGGGGGVGGNSGRTPGSGARGFVRVAYLQTLLGSINVSANVPVTSWMIMGPTMITGSGTTASYASQSAGIYTIVWGAVPGYLAPLPQTLSIANAGDTISFVGTYTSLAPVGPNVDLKVDGSDAPTIAGGTTVPVSWTSSGAVSCEITSGYNWAGANNDRATSGTDNVTIGVSGDYSMRCINASGVSMSDTVHVNAVCTPSTGTYGDCNCATETKSRTNINASCLPWTESEPCTTDEKNGCRDFNWKEVAP